MGLVGAYGLLSSVQDEFSPVLAYLGILGMPCELQVPRLRIPHIKCLY